MMTYREIIQAISQRLGCANASLPIEDRDSLLEQLQQRNEIAANGKRVRHTTKLDTAQSSKNIEDLRSDLEDSQAEDIFLAVDFPKESLRQRDGNHFTYTARRV